MIEDIDIPGRDEAEGGGKQVIARAAAVLRTLENRDRGLGCGAIAGETGLPRTTVTRIVQALEAQQMVCKGQDGWKLGPALTRLAASAHTDIAGLARPHMEAAARHTRETVQLLVARGELAILVEQCPSDQVLRVVHRVGAALPMYCTAPGKALLAQLSDEEIVRLLVSPLEARTPRTLASISELTTRLVEVRATRVAENWEEYMEGICGVAAVVRTGSGERYALSISAPTHRFARAKDALTGTLLRTVGAIEASLGVK